MRVSSSKILSVSLTISLHLLHMNPSSPTERNKLYMWQAVQTTVAGEEAITHCDWWMIHLPLLFDELVRNGNGAREKENGNRRE